MNAHVLAKIPNKSKREYIRHYEQMLLIRKCEESFVAPIMDEQIRCPVHLYSGQEATAVGLSAHLGPHDLIFGNHRSHGHYLAKGGDLYSMIAEIYCREDGCAKGRGGSMHVIDKAVGMLGAAPIVAGTVSLALGAALVLKNKKKRNVAITYFGDGATGEGVLFEAMNFAAMRKLPIIFICENNLYSTHLPISETRPKTPIHHLGKSFGITSFSVGGNNLLDTLKYGKMAVDLCRAGKGPVFLEMKTYRYRGHVGPNDNIQGTQTDIRPQAEIEYWKRRDPITKFAKVLLSGGIVTKEELKRIESAVDKRILAAHQKAASSPRPSPEELTKYVFK